LSGRRLHYRELRLRQGISGESGLAARGGVGGMGARGAAGASLGEWRWQD